MLNSRSTGKGDEGAGTPAGTKRPNSVPFVETLATAEELIDALRPNASRWSPSPSDWVFRGQRDWSWELLPAAFRPGAWKFFRSPTHEPTVEPAVNEFRVLQAFLDGLDRAGLDVPNAIFLPQLFEDGAPGLLSFPLDPAALTLAALAQHYRIPTRLLDWTRVALNAAYFAAAGAAENLQNPKEEHPECLSVWAFRSEFGKWCDEEFAKNNINTRKVRVAAAPRASNPNLHAQSGVFTESTEKDPIERTVRELVQMLEPIGGQFPVANPLVRFDLPCSESPKLLRLLANEQIDGARMFPGREGVVLAMKERSLWDR